MSRYLNNPPKEISWRVTDGVSDYKRGEVDDALEFFQKSAEPAFERIESVLDQYEYILNAEARCKEDLQGISERDSTYETLVTNLEHQQELIQKRIEGIQAYQFGTSASRKRSTKRRKVSPLTRLPAEVLAEVFNYLSTRDLSVALRVSRDWQDMVLSVSDYLRRPIFVSDMSVSDLRSYETLCKKSGIGSPKLTVPCVKSGQSYELLRALKGLNVSDLSISCSRFRHSDETALHTVKRLRVVTGSSYTWGLARFVGCFPRLRDLTIELGLTDYSSLNAIDRGTLPKLESLELAFIWNGSDPHKMERHSDRFFESLDFREIGALSVTDVPLRPKHLTKLLATRPHSIYLDSVDLKTSQVFSVLRSINLKPTSLDLTGLEFNRSRDLSCLSNLETARFSVMHLGALPALIRGTRLKELTLNADFDPSVGRDIGAAVDSRGVERLWVFSPSTAGVQSLVSWVKTAKLYLEEELLTPEMVALLESKGQWYRIFRSDPQAERPDCLRID